MVFYYHSEIKKLFQGNKGRYDVRRIYQELAGEVTKLLIIKEFNVLKHINGLFENALKRKYHSYQGNVGKLLMPILTDFTADRPLQKWSSQMSQFTFSWGKCFFSPILDMSTNEINLL